MAKDPWKLDELLFLPLGGAGEIGMNMNLYGYGGKWLMVDLGITFAEDGQPGIDILTPDPAFIEERRDDLLALVITHAHEDHLGAVPYLWRRLGCPVYATPFAAAVLRRKLIEDNLLTEVELIEIDIANTLSLGAFDLSFISLTHSIPEMAALSIRTPVGTVLHTGDWKLDPDPLVGPKSDEETLAELGDEGILAVVCDSTNVLEDGWSGSEGEVRKNLIKLVGECEQRVAITCFASNVARMESAIVAATENDRHPVMVGRSLHRIFGAAREAGYLTDLPRILDEDEAGYLPPEKVLYICTGCQGEPRGAMARIASGNHPHISLSQGDAVIFSSREIPGNEQSIRRIQTQLRLDGIDVHSEGKHMVHVSGHPCRDELIHMYQLTRPEIAVPVHGEAQHLLAHGELAREMQVPDVPIIENGQVLRLAPGTPEVVGEVQSGRLAIDGKVIVDARGDALRERKKLMYNGGAVVTIVVDEDGFTLADPSLVIRGVAEAPGSEGELTEELAGTITKALDKLSKKARLDDQQLSEAARLIVTRRLKKHSGKRPMVDARVIRV